jgi:hypothetical protein
MYAALAPWLPPEMWASETQRGVDVKACRKATKRRFKALSEPAMPAEVVALDLLKRRCGTCTENCWRAG